MIELRCNDYGFECPFVSRGKEDSMIEGFGEHMAKVHGIEYQKEVIVKS